MEVSELAEALRGKGRTGDPRDDAIEEAGDVLFVLASILYTEGISFAEVVAAIENKLDGITPIVEEPILVPPIEERERRMVPKQPSAYSESRVTPCTGYEDPGIPPARRRPYVDPSTDDPEDR